VKNIEASLNEKVKLALSESESRFQAIVSNIPGLVFQMQIDQLGNLHFVYLSDGCEALLGISAIALQENAQLLFSIMNSQDSEDLSSKLTNTKESFERLDWEGRVWIDGWQDTKWINLRATTSRLESGIFQWSGIMLNITQGIHEKQQIEQSRRDLAQLTAHMNKVKEEERINIAREIHDDLGGNLTAIKMGLSSIAKQIAAGKSVCLEQTASLEVIVNHTFDAVHRISGNLRPSILELGIVDAIEWQVNQFKKQTHIDCTFVTNQLEMQLSTEHAMALYRICQESLSNISKYAEATLVKVKLAMSDNQVHMTIQDNGVGIHEADKFKQNSFGLRGMQERVSALAGSLSIKSKKFSKHGTLIEVKIPL
jgi:two-component system, NarL family, sensor histidine kinase UhpB